MALLDHVSINVSDYERSKNFYAQALAPLGVTVLKDYGVACGLGRDKPDLWLAKRPDEGGKPAAVSPVHLALSAGTREEVDAFYAAAIAAGGKDNGGPGVRAQYHPGYYGAFVLDPDGHNLEAVCHKAP